MTIPFPGLPVTPLTGGINSGGGNNSNIATVLGDTFNQALTATTNLAIDNAAIIPAHSVTNVGLNTPPPLRTLVYSPEVRIVIGTSLKGQRDVSADVVRFTLIRPENSAASFFFTLHNKGLRYTPTIGRPFFSRMDRITVYMKKTHWVQVFSGYLDSIPYAQLYPGEVNFKATCTLKRLMHTWINAALPETKALMNQFSTPEAKFQGDGQMGSDSGLGSILRRLLMMLGNWPITGIHIQNFPTVFFSFIQQQVIMQQQMNAPGVQRLQNMFLGDDTSPGPGAYAGHNPNAGPSGPTIGASGMFGWATSFTDATTAFYLTQIVAACDNRGMGPLASINNAGAAIQQAGIAGVAGTAAGGAASLGTGSDDTKAWQQIQQTGADMQQANLNADGAILGVACALVETGGGVTIRNLANPAMPGSDQFPNDGMGTNGTSVGIFQQQNYSEWGDLTQRMNPLQAASMFFAKLNGVSGWRSMDPGQAIQQVQRGAATTTALYDGAIALATKLVQAYRTSTVGSASTLVPNTGVGNMGTTTPTSSLSALASGMGGGPGLVGGAVGTPTVSPGLNTANPTSMATPQPDSEGAINFATTQIGQPYVWGQAGPAGFDCSGLVAAAFKSIGVAVPHGTQDIAAQLPSIPQTAVQRGDLVEPHSDHVIIWCGDGTIIEATEPSVRRVPNPYGPPGTWAGAYRVCQNGGVNPAASFNPPWTMGAGSPPAALDQQGGALSTGSGGSSEGVARNLFSYMFNGTYFEGEISKQWPTDKAFVDGEPLINLISAICSSSLRCFSSAPNGDFMAWYPDYFGIDGKPAVLYLSDMELKDVHIDFADDPLTTHVFVEGNYSQTGDEGADQGWLATAGVVGVDTPWLYYRMIAVAPGDLESMAGAELERRFGVRPLRQTASMAGTHELELTMAMQIFMQKWAEQYRTTITMTFMPELFPGMRVLLGNHNLAVYVTEVTTVGDFAQGFSTSATIMAPSSGIPAKQLMQSVNYTTPDVGPDGLPAYMRAFLQPFVGAIFGSL